MAQKPNRLIQARIDEALSTRFFVVNWSGPTCAVLRTADNAKFKVRLGCEHTCSCGDIDMCVHILFVLLKCFDVPKDNPLAWEKRISEHSLNQIIERKLVQAAERSRVRQSFLRRKPQVVTSPEPSLGDAVEQRDIEEGEVCPICQEDMLTGQNLTYCKTSCGNSLHVECMKIWAEHRSSMKEDVTCPYCRKSWGSNALTTLKQSHNTTRTHTGTTCCDCQKSPIRGVLYRCLDCKPLNYCRRCFRVQNRRIGHRGHHFVKREVCDGSWIPVVPERKISSQLVRDLQARQLSTEDYELLLALDQPKPSLAEFLARFCLSVPRSAAEERCCVCNKAISPLTDMSMMRDLRCGHVGHEECLLRRFAARNFVCPVDEKLLFPGLAQVVNPLAEVLAEPLAEDLWGAAVKVNSLRKKAVSAAPAGRPSQRRERPVPLRAAGKLDLALGLRAGPAQNTERLPVGGAFGGVKAKPRSLSAKHRRRGRITPPLPPEALTRIEARRNAVELGVVGKETKPRRSSVDIAVALSVSPPAVPECDWVAPGGEVVLSPGPATPYINPGSPKITPWGTSDDGFEQRRAAARKSRKKAQAWKTRRRQLLETAKKKKLERKDSLQQFVQEQDDRKSRRPPSGMAGKLAGVSTVSGSTRPEPAVSTLEGANLGVLGSKTCIRSPSPMQF